MTDKRIMWESQHLEIDPHTGAIIDPTVEEYEWVEEDQMENEMMAAMPPKQLTATAWGIWNINDAMHPMKQFKLWMGHTNFNISETVTRQIEEIPGVEVLKIISR